MTPEPTAEQRSLARRLSIDIKGVSARVASARLRAAVALAIDSGTRWATTAAQQAIAKQLRLRGLSPFSAVAAAEIAAALELRNDRAFQKYGFQPGMTVEFVGGAAVFPLAIPKGAVHEISTVTPTGRIYLRGAGGRFAYACQLRPYVGRRVREPLTRG